jgi:hypothetical protein
MPESVGYTPVGEKVAVALTAFIDSIDDLLERLPDAKQVTENVTIRGIGTVTVRAISLEQHRSMRTESTQGDAMDWTRWDTFALVNGVVRPQMTYDQALKLRKKAIGPVQDILDAIWRVSGLTERGEIKAEAAEAAEATFREGPDQVQDT